MSAAGPPLTCWSAPDGTLLKQFLTPAEHEDVPRDYRAWYDQVSYNKHAVYALNAFYLHNLEKVECRVSPPTPPPAQAALTRPQDDPRPDEIQGVMQYRDKAQGAVLPLVISSTDYHGKYRRYQNRYDGIEQAGDNDMGLRVLPVLPVSYSRYRLNERMINNGSLTPLHPMAKPQYDPREDKITPNSYYYEVEHGAVLPMTVRYEEIQDYGKYRIYKHHYDRMERVPYYGLDSKKVSNGLLEYVGTENTDEAVEEYKRRKAEQEAEVPTATRSRIRPNVYYKAPDSELVLPEELDVYEYQGPRYENYKGYYRTGPGSGGALSGSAVYKLDLNRIQDERFTILDDTGSPSREREREHSWAPSWDTGEPMYRSFGPVYSSFGSVESSASAAPWPSITGAVLAAHARAKARRRAAGAAGAAARVPSLARLKL